MPVLATYPSSLTACCQGAWLNFSGAMEIQIANMDRGWLRFIYNNYTEQLQIFVFSITWP